MGNWASKAQEDSDSNVNLLPVYLRAARANSTIKAYSSLFSAFSHWCTRYNLNFLPATDSTVALFLISKHQAKVCSQTISSYISAIKWAHKLANKDDPTEKFLVREVAEACKRLPQKKQNKIRQPLPFSVLVNICTIAKNKSLASLRTACLFSLGFHGFLRSHELLNLKRKDLKIKENKNNEYLQIYIEESKTDRYKRGNKIVLSARQDATCPVSLIKEYFQKASLNKKCNSSQKIFCNLAPDSNKLEFSKPLGYSRFREIFRDALRSVKCSNISNLSCHSLRIGGATFAVKKGIPKNLIKKHGRWLTDNVFESYARNSLNQQLSVTK